MPADEIEKNDDHNPDQEEVCKENTRAFPAGDAQDRPAEHQQSQAEEQNMKALFVKGQFSIFHAAIRLYRQYLFSALTDSILIGQGLLKL
jgi:hypothetical protein